MKHKFLLATLAMSFVVGCSSPSSRRPASVSALSSLIPMVTNDVGVVGPNGEVLLYYKEGNHIIVKNCDPYTVLGATPETARKKCQGKKSKVPVESFKQGIRSLVNTDNMKLLKPVTPDEVQEFNKKDEVSPEELAKMEEELERINAFIQAYGSRNANLVKKQELEKAIASPKGRAQILKKINGEIEKTISAIADNKLTIVDSSCLEDDSKTKDQFMYTVLKKFDPSVKYPCSSVEACALSEGSSKGSFKLVSRAKDFTEIWKDEKSGLTWSDRLPNRMSQYDAIKACENFEATGKPKGSWKLPSIDEYKKANSNGIRSALPNMGYWYWSSSVHADYSNDAWDFNGSSGHVDDAGRDYVGDSVRCVAK